MPHDRPQNLSATQALARLKAGNARFVAGTTDLSVQASRRSELAGGQKPYATIICCADSRVGPEILFDEGLGDLFVIRVAGNIATDAVMGSLEFASLRLGVNLVVVCGHRSCGAVTAAVQHVDATGAVTGTHIDALIDAIRPAVRKAQQTASAGLIDASIRANAAHNARVIATDQAAMADLVARGVRVLPAYYDLESGVVTIG